MDAGPKGAVVTFRKNEFSSPEGLVGFMAHCKGALRLHPDHKLVYKANWTTAEARLQGIRWLARELADIAGKARKTA